MKNQKGFTLIELLVVITIIGILAVAFLPNVLSAPARARDAARIADMKKIADLITARLVTNPNSLPSPESNLTYSGCLNTSNKYFDPLMSDLNGQVPTSQIVPGNGLSTVCPNGEYFIQVVGKPNAFATQGNYVSNPYRFAVIGALENAASITPMQAQIPMNTNTQANQVTQKGGDAGAMFCKPSDGLYQSKWPIQIYLPVYGNQPGATNLPNCYAIVVK